MYYDLGLTIIETIFKKGWHLVSLIGVVIVFFFKQRKTKKRIEKHFPWLFGDDSEIKEYVRNQIVIMKNQEKIMLALGVEPCVTDLNEKPRNSVRKPNTFYSTFLATLTTARNVEKYTVRRYYKMTKKIALDAGHGGKDPGAIGVTGTKEKDFALTMVKKIEQRLKANKNISPILIRDNDKFLELSERVSIAKKKKVDIFISIHANSSGTGASGTETYYTREDSRALADIIHKHLIEATGLRDRKVKKDSLHVTRETNMPAVLLEPAFINNPDDEKKLFDPAFQDRVADAIVAGIYEYFGITIEAPQPTQPVTTYKEMEVTVHTDPVGRYTGYNIKGSTWVPSRPIGEQMGGKIGYTGGMVTIDGEAVETQNIGGIGYVTARDMTRLLGARIFWDKNEPHKVDIFIK